MAYDIKRTKKIQEVILRIMKRLHSVLDDNGYTYYLWAGSVLGAIRHNGFIPWDDDMDIAMPRADYDRFVANAYQILPEDLYIQSPDNCKDTIVLFAKVRLKGTLFEELSNQGLNYPKGIFVDIFPIDFSNETYEKNRKYWAKLWIYKKIYLCQRRSDGKHPFFSTLSKLASHEEIYKKVDKLVHSKFQQEGKFAIDTYSFGDFNSAWFESNLFDKPILHKFENTQFYIPKDSETYLKKAYGDYMVLPPEEKRGIQHDVKRVEFEYDDSRFFSKK